MEAQPPQDGNPPAQAAAAQPDQVIAFARTPAVANAGTLDFSESGARKIFEMATKPIMQLTTLTAVTMAGFFQLLSIRSVQYGWNRTIFAIPVNGEEKDLLADINTIPLTAVQEVAQIYLAIEGRAAQDNEMAVTAITASIDSKELTKVAKWKDKFHFGSYTSAAALLHVLHGQNVISPNAQADHIRRSLNVDRLKEKMSECDNDIKVFNEYVADQQVELASFQQTSSDLRTCLFAVYNECPDQDFRSYVLGIKNQHNDGRLTVTADKLLGYTTDYFKGRITDKDGTAWCNTSGDADLSRLGVLEAKFKAVQFQAKGKGTGKKQQRKDKPAWMTKVPKENEKRKPKQVNGKDYWWCPNHKAYTVHKPHECKGVGFIPRGGKPAGQNNGERDRRLRLEQSLNAVAAMADQDE
jgi:hypothetical protein